jgi:ABC-type transport system involved in multi-copper enzyme maturation permease subunit
MTSHVETPTTIDLSGTKQVPLTRLTRVELRKMADTRAGLWLLIAIGAITAAIILVFFLNAPADERTFSNFIGITATPQGFLLPVLGILLVTSEWNQRTAMVTFTLTPHRGRVMLAKTLAALALGLAAILVAVVVAALATLAGGGTDPWQGIGADDFGKFVILEVSAILQGLAFGLVFLNSAVAIVTFFILPTAFSILSSLWKALEKAQPWIDLGTSQQPLFSGADVSTEQWAQLATGSALWIVLPFLIGLLRVLRREVK